MTPGVGSALEAPRGTRSARWGIFVTSLVMGGVLVATGLRTWLQQREAAASISEAWALDLFRAVRRSLRDEGAPRAARDGDAGPALAELLAEFDDAGLRYVAVVVHGEVVGEAGRARGKLASLVPDHGGGPPGEPGLTRIGERLRIDGGLGPRRRDHGPRLVLEVEPVLAQDLVAAALEQLVVSAVAAVLLVALSFVFWRMAARADRFAAALGKQRQLAALGEMSAVLGHEVRNPLAALKGHAQLVLERVEPEHRAYKSAERVVREAERIETLTGHILDFARTGAVTPRDEDPVAMVRAVVDKLGAVNIVLDVARAPGRWRFDRPRMEQVVENIVKNAIQAGGDAPIDVVCERAHDDTLVLRVRDRGPGFPPGEEGAVFEPFRTHRVQGTGLGLAIARRIVDAHGGTITARNADGAAGGGAVVTVTLPREPRATADAGGA